MVQRDDPFERMNRMFEEMARQFRTDPTWSVRAYDADDDRSWPAMGAGRYGADADRDVPARYDADAMEHRHPGRGRDHGATFDVEPTDEGYVVTADLPGFETEDLSITFDDGVLTVRGEHEVVDEGEMTTHRSSRRVFEQRRFPESVLVEDITASYRNGVLEIHVPTEEDEAGDSHHIDIE